MSKRERRKRINEQVRERIGRWCGRQIEWIIEESKRRRQTLGTEAEKAPILGVETQAEQTERLKTRT